MKLCSQLICMSLSELTLMRCSSCSSSSSYRRLSAEDSLFFSDLIDAEVRQLHFWNSLVYCPIVQSSADEVRVTKSLHIDLKGSPLDVLANGVLSLVDSSPSL
jgi:hypothetical protein